MSDMPGTDARIAQLEAELAAVRREMQEFTSIVSHDLRAPLRHIVSFAALVKEDAGPQLGGEVQGFLDTIADSAAHLGRMLDALLELSRIGTVGLQPTTVALQDAVTTCCAELQRSYSTRVIDWRIAADLPAVQADPLLLRLALRHVLDNAVKFSAGQAAAVIDIHAQSRAHGVLLTVQDNGAGFNPALQAKLFTPFCRLHSAREFAGLGMGLASAHKALQRMGASVAVTGEVAGGCSVQMQLPAAPSS